MLQAGALLSTASLPFLADLCSVSIVMLLPLLYTRSAKTEAMQPDDLKLTATPSGVYSCLCLMSCT